MALVIEDGTGVVGANTYASSSDLTAYAALTDTAITGTNEVLLHSAKRYIETLRFIGRKASSTNEMQWPRVGAMIDGFYLESTEIPQLLIDLQCEVALSIDAGIDPLATKSRATKKEKVGDIEVEYMDGASVVEINPSINALASKLIANGSLGGVSLSLSRA
jgi:hypothetical protein